MSRDRSVAESWRQMAEELLREARVDEGVAEAKRASAAQYIELAEKREAEDSAA